MTAAGVVVVGASLAGLRAAEELRAAGFGDRITVVGDEVHPPYDRPPLSKQVLAGTWDVDRIGLVAGPAGLEGLDLDWRLGTRAAGLDLAGRRVMLVDGEPIPFDGLVIATGATPRRLPGTEHLTGVHTLRTIDDCLTVRRALDERPGRVVVVGGGFIGAEVAATCRGRGIDVTLVEALPVPLGRVLGDDIGAVMAGLHRDHGVDVRLGVGVEGLDARGGVDGRVGRVRLADGSTVDADLVVVGVGVAPATGWLDGSGLRLEDGVVCDETTLAAPDVVAAGDVARWPSPRVGALVRVEHWDNAITMGVHAARRLLASLGAPGGTTAAYDPVPWFWSDQYDRKIQLTGWSAGADEARVVDGSTDDRRFVALYRRGDRLAAVLAMNRPRAVMGYRALIERGASWSEALAEAGAA
ncbi:MAG TPA: FAD/NAD(P)-binding oxidoreductase [Acidimicrobiales bacterium]|nr:FAD/NAD(P)-binding oxidoreductase [Acidimicrobiales bacterium]